MITEKPLVLLDRPWEIFVLFSKRDQIIKKILEYCPEAQLNHESEEGHTPLQLAESRAGKYVGEDLSEAVNLLKSYNK